VNPHSFRIRDIDIIFSPTKGVFYYNKKKSYKYDNYSPLTNPFENEIDEKVNKSNNSLMKQGITFCISRNCNLICKYCYGRKRDYKTTHAVMDPKTANAAIDSIIKYSPKINNYSINFFGGEPFLNFPVMKLIVERCRDLEAKGKSFKFSVTTNATLIDEEMVHFLVQNNFGVLVSFDGTKRFQNKYRPFINGKGSYRIVRENINLLSRLLPIELRGTIVREMIHKNALRKIYFNKQFQNVKKVFLAPVDCSHLEEAPFSLRHSEIIKMNETLIGITQENLSSIRSRNKLLTKYDPSAAIIRKLYFGEFNKSKCGACNSMMAVSVDGLIFPCHRFLGLNNFVIGNIWDGINTNRVERFFEAHYNATKLNCSNCWAKILCGGYCLYNLATSEGDFNPPKEEVCAMNKMYYEHAMYFLSEYKSEILREQKVYLL
jgi:uncharacterized protein